MPKTYFVSALGCKVNQYEAQMIREALESLGLRQAPAGQPADITVVNTCAVTRTAARKSRQAVRHHARSRSGRVIAIGCGPIEDALSYDGLAGVISIAAQEASLSFSAPSAI